jgi:2-polyprenyl-6-methoxyphenol hydroxylase-like FAD-dependent oxidoreductase
MPLKVIVSGAGIAGLALSHWLDRIGATTIIVERAPRFQALGHYISLKGNGVEMVRRMGMLDACEASAAPIEEVYFYTASRRLLRSERTAALAKALGGYILFRRVDLQAALYELVRERTDIRFGTQIAEVRPAVGGVEVRLSDGRVEWGDLLVGADGIHSHVRSLVFGEGFERSLGGHYNAIAQVEMPRITQDRCALIGDAAHCPTFLSGMGSSLALQDAHVLAGCLARNPAGFEINTRPLKG